MALALAACGDEDDGSAESGEQPSGQTKPSQETEPSDEPGAPPPPIPRHQFVVRADEICDEAQRAIAEESRAFRKLVVAVSQRKISQSEYFRRGGEVTQRSGEIAQQAVADLKGLPPPTSRRDAVEAYLAGASEQAETLAAQGDALAAGDPKEVTRLEAQLVRVRTQTREAAKRVGFRVCGGGR